MIMISICLQVLELAVLVLSDKATGGVGEEFADDLIRG
jgi:hypothetical protein